MTYELLLAEARKLEQSRPQEDNVLLTDAKIIAFLLDHCEITVPDTSEYFVQTNISGNDDRILRVLIAERREKLREEFITQEYLTAVGCRAYFGNQDFGHTAPVWENILSLGLSGLRSRIANRKGVAKNPHFVQAEQLVFEATERFLHRCADEAEKAGKLQMAEGLRHLAVQPPRNLFECYQLILVFYNLQQFFDGTDVRTLGRMDQLTLPFYEAEPDKQYIKKLTHQFILEIDALQASANMPFALAGTDENGISQVNPMSYILLDAYADTMLPHTKLHILCTENMPRDFLRKCMDCVKQGGNSLVFINNQLMIDGLVQVGLSREDAAGYAIVGCYEASGKEEVPCSCNARLSLPKALEVTLHGGKDGITGKQIGMDIPAQFNTFGDLYQAYMENVALFVRGCIWATDNYEARYSRFHASPFFSASLTGCVENGGDAYADHAARYNNSSINVIGLGTVTDSLYAIRKLVYEDKRMSLAQLVEILDRNWEGSEPLRQMIRNKFPKYGTGDRTVDALAVDMTDKLSAMINNTPNAKGGVYRMGIFSINWRKEWGEQTAASADGRFSRQTLSQNASCTFGMDREGPTGHILSVASLNSVNAVNGCVLDLDLHSSAIRGDNGTNVLLATLDTFFASGGQTVHYNVLDTQALREAQENPEKFPNLQVRLCGWNVLFTQLSRKSQDEFIARSEMNAG